MRAALLIAIAAAAPISAPALANAQSGGPAPPAALTATLAAVGTRTSSDGRRTNGDFVKNLGRNAIGLYDHDNVVPFLIGAGATGAAAFFDDNGKRYFGERRRAKWLGDFADGLGRPYIIGPIAGALYGLGRMSTDHARFRAWTYDIAQVTIVSGVYTEALKYASHRLRPDGSDHLSFPSGHTSNAFAWATIANHYGGKRLGVPAYLFAGMIAVGRMEKNVHYLSDVTGGATLGYLAARTVMYKDGALPSTDTSRVPFGAVPETRAVPIFRFSVAF